MNTKEILRLNPHIAEPPRADCRPRSVVFHDEMLVDEYFWLRERENPEVIDYLNAENSYTEAVMKPTVELQETLYHEMLGRIKQTDESVPYKFGEYFYGNRTEEGKQYPILFRRLGSIDAPDEITLDLNELAEGKEYLSLGAYEVSDNGRLLAYTLDTRGFREYTLYIKDLTTGELLPDRIEKVSGISWAADNRTIFYVTEDEAKRPCRVLRHRLGEKEDELVLEENDQLFRSYIQRSMDRSAVFMYSVSSTTTEVWWLSSDDPGKDPQVILPRREGHEYYLDCGGDYFYISTNDGAKNFRIVRTLKSNPAPENWEEVVPHNPDILIRGYLLFADYCVLSEAENGLSHLRVIDLKDQTSHRVPVPEDVYVITATARNNREYRGHELRYHYESLTTPSSVYTYDMKERNSRLLKRLEVLGGYKPENYLAERITATAADGTGVPISLVYRKGIKRDGSNPLILYGYGAYGHAIPPHFSFARLSLLDRGVIYAVAHIRGGNDLGETWHDQGKLMNKKNTFTDFIACAEHLIAEKYTAADRITAMGGSAGGLLVGATVNMRPDLFGAAVLDVPFVDVVNTMTDPTLPLTVGEYLEWGNPNEKEAYEYIRSYCPYTNLEAKRYPNILVNASLHDSQVMYWEPAKYVARLRTLIDDDTLLLLRTNMTAGHSGASGRYDHLKEAAFDYAFILSNSAEHLNI